MTVFLGLTAIVAAIVAIDWRRSSKLKRALNAGDAHDPRALTRSELANDAMRNPASRTANASNPMQNIGGFTIGGGSN